MDQSRFQSRFLPLGFLWVTIFLTGCLGTTTVSHLPSPQTRVSGPDISTVNLSAIAEPWRGPAAKLARQGFTQQQLEAVFDSPNLKYTSGPMSAKLKELYGIFHKSDLTRSVQENLYQLGYDLRIDGQNGSGTKATMRKFQKDRGLAVTAEVSEATLAATAKAMRGAKLRSLAGYKPPPSPKPSRTATYRHFTSPSALAKITAYYKADKKTFQQMGRRFKVPGEVVAAIMWVETGYGTFFGKQKAASQLASMAAAASDFKVVKPALTALPTDRESMKFLQETAVKRGDWALNELAALMRYSFKNGHDTTVIPGSIYGAVGWGQFMPSNIIKFGVDGNGDGKVDMFDKYDAIYSIGNYLKGHGWKGGDLEAMNEDARRAVIMKYNKSGMYVNTVLFVAQHLGRK